MSLDAPIPAAAPARPPVSPVPPAGAHGDDARRVARALGVDPANLLDLATTLNPVAPDITAHVAGAAGAVRWYPDPGRATAALAERLEVDPDLVVLTNGGAEAIALVAAERPVGSVEGPEFSLYERHLAGAGPDRWASNPNNPTGRLAAPDEVAAVWDEAHYPLATGRWSRRDPGAVHLGSLTKLLACPGLRLGYVVVPDPALAARLRNRQPAWSVNAIACEVLPDLLDLVDLGAWSARIAGLREDLATLLRAHGFHPAPSDAPWLLVPASAGLRERLAPLGVLVRDATSFGLAGHTRVGVPDERGLERLAVALARGGDQAG